MSCYFSHTMPPDGEAEQLAARGIRVVDGAVASLEIAGDRLTGVRLADGTVVSREALAVAPRMAARAGFCPDRPRAGRTSVGLVEYIPADAAG